MCKAIEDWMDEGIVTLIRNLSTSQNISIAQAMDMLLIPEADRERYRRAWQRPGWWEK